jgi:hypothetical protein
VLAGKKHLLKGDELIIYDVRRYAEFSVKNIYEVFKNDARVLSFLPDLKKASKLPDRDWVFAVVCSLKPEFMSQQIEYAENVRNKEKMPSDKHAQIEISQEYLTLLEQTPYIASK